MLKTLTQAKCNRTLEGNIEDMTQVFIDLCKADPNNFEAQATYGKICSGKKEYDKALESFERAVMLARQPQELKLAVQELVLTRAAKEANYLLEQLTQEAK
uniref:Tetratricopeptide repeat protein n=1 Tax=Panagrolaimus sp. JU765 TaxID=591449 RepID=A0AC34QAV7_9BILA